MTDPMRTHRQKEGLGWGIALLGVILTVPVVMFKGAIGFLILVAALVVACIVYYT